jgi:hypothetical protein
VSLRGAGVELKKVKGTIGRPCPARDDSSLPPGDSQHCITSRLRYTAD